jgi:hypothetical protein
MSSGSKLRLMIDKVAAAKAAAKAAAAAAARRLASDKSSFCVAGHI